MYKKDKILFLDTEFNGFGGELISMALVAYPSMSYWSDALDTSGMIINDWVLENVMPNLGRHPITPRNQFRASLLSFLYQYDRPKIVCDWHSDVKYLCDLLLGDSHEQSVPLELSFEVVMTPPGEPVSMIPHNALSDAMALLEWYNGKFIKCEKTVEC